MNEEAAVPVSVELRRQRCIAFMGMLADAKPGMSKEALLSAVAAHYDDGVVLTLIDADIPPSAPAVDGVEGDRIAAANLEKVGLVTTTRRDDGVIAKVKMLEAGRLFLAALHRAEQAVPH